MKDKRSCFTNSAFGLFSNNPRRQRHLKAALCTST
uniref:Uncharacterized protein n=1 Tax=Arundo donax TaxID=35708 RepID=A0A0A9GCE1_ARUDO